MNEEELFKLSNKDAKKYLTKVIEKQQQRLNQTSQITTGSFRQKQESQDFDRAGESMMLGGRFKPSHTKGSKELTMELNMLEPGMATTTFAERGRVGTDLFHNV